MNRSSVLTKPLVCLCTSPNLIHRDITRSLYGWHGLTEPHSHTCKSIDVLLKYLNQYRLNTKCTPRATSVNLDLKEKNISFKEIHFRIPFVTCRLFCQGDRVVTFKEMYIDLSLRKISNAHRVYIVWSCYTTVVCLWIAPCMARPWGQIWVVIQNPDVFPYLSFTSYT